MKRQAAFTLIELPFDGLRTVRKRKSEAFTLIELLIVIGVLAVMVTILVPVVGGQIEEARRTSCRANLRAIGQKMVEYANDPDSKGRFPTALSKMYTGGAACLWSGKTDGTTYRMTAPIATDDTSVTASQWLLVRGEVDGKPSLPVEAFICPSSDDTRDDFTDSGDVKRDVSLLYDFKSRSNISYSFFMPYGEPILSLLSKPDMGIAADKSPFFDNATGTLVAGITPAANNKTNSSNNHRQEGQNVVFNDGRADWYEFANAGINGDHIYTRYLEPYAAGGEYDPQVGAVGNNYTIEITGDSFVAP